MNKNNPSIQSGEILESLDVGFLALDRNWHITYINKLAATYFGLKPDNVIEPNLWEKLVNIIGTEHEIHYHRAMDQGESQVFETQSSLHNRWFHIRVRPSTEGIFVYWEDTTDRKLFEEAFKRTIESFGETQTLARIGSWEYSVDTRVMTWSAETYVLYERDSKLGPPSLEENQNYYSADQIKAFRDYIEQATKTGQTVSCNLEIRLPSGKSAYHHTMIHPIKDASGRVIKLYGAEQDITERKQAEEKLRESEEKYRNLVEATSDCIWEVNVDGIYTYVSPRIFDILGYKQEEVLGKTPFDLMPPPEAERVKKMFDQYMSQKKSFASMENINRRKDGSLIVLESNGVPFYGTKGKLLGYRGIDRDITQRKKIEDALAKAKEELEKKVVERTAQLAESEEKYRLLVENASEFIAVAQDGLIKFTNKKALELTGYLAEEINNKPILELVHKDDRELVKEHYRKHVAGEAAPTTYEFRFVPKDGSTRWAQISTAKIIWNKRPAILAIFTDITEHRKLEQELKNYAQKVTKLLEEERKRI